MKNIQKNYQRLLGKEYSVEYVFRPQEYGWAGDWEGRALLAFTCHYNMSGQENPSMHLLIEKLKEKTNAKMYLGKEFDGVTVDEQQISGHSWFLRGLIEYSIAFNSTFAKEVAKSTVENLYLPIAEWYERYPIDRNKIDGDVSGHSAERLNGWKLSTDVGCAFMCVDGLAHYFALTKDKKVKEFLDKVIGVFDSLDKVKLGFQTHTTLSCVRGILKLFETTGEEKYFNIAKRTFDEYLNCGMTLTYQNYNWYGRKDSWTEPCAVVDSFILATEIYKITRIEKYLTVARRIWFNGLQFCQRNNGGAGTDSCATKEFPFLKMNTYEAPFCCTMRYSEGLLEYLKNKELFGWDSNATEKIDQEGRRFVDDKLIVLLNGQKVPIFSCVDLDREQIEKVQLKIIF